MSKDFGDSKYGERETARFKGPDRKALNDAISSLGLSKSDALRMGIKALLLLPELQVKISTLVFLLPYAQTRTAEIQMKILESQSLLNNFVSSMGIREESIKSLSVFRPTTSDRRRTFVRQRTERRVSCGV